LLVSYIKNAGGNLLIISYEGDSYFSKKVSVATNVNMMEASSVEIGDGCLGNVVRAVSSKIP